MIKTFVVLVLLSTPDIAVSSSRYEKSKQKYTSLKVSSDGRKLIKWFEQLRLTAYRDVGVWSIGYGSRAAHRYPYTISRVKAEQLFQRDIIHLEKWLNMIILRQKQKQHQFDAIASWTYNIGHGAALSSTLIRRYNLGEPPSEVAQEFMFWVYITDPKTGKKIRKRGLISRREIERKLFMNGKLEFF